MKLAIERLKIEKEKEGHGEFKRLVTRKNLKNFLLDNPSYWEPGKVDKYWLIDLLR